MVEALQQALSGQGSVRYDEPFPEWLGSALKVTGTVLATQVRRGAELKSWVQLQQSMHLCLNLISFLIALLIRLANLCQVFKAQFTPMPFHDVSLTFYSLAP